MKPELIFALPATYVEELKAQSIELTPGLYQLPPAAEWQPQAENVLFAQRRETLEKDNNARQLNPYFIPRTWAADIGKWLYHPYKRIKGSGEEGLFDKVSIGGGGHVDLIDGSAESNEVDPSTISIANTVRKNLEREAKEEFTVVNRSTMQAHGQGAYTGIVITDLASRAIIITNGLVEDRHMGLVTYGSLPYGQEVVYKEAGLVSMGPMTADEILSLEGVVLEDWTRIILENQSDADRAAPAEDGSPEAIGLGVIGVTHFGMWCNEVDFFKTFMQRPDSDFELFEGEEPMEAVNRILKKHEVNGLINNCAMARKVISLAAVSIAHDHGEPMLEMLARQDELNQIKDAERNGNVAVVAPATAALLSELVPVPEGGSWLTPDYLIDRLFVFAQQLTGQPNKMKLLRILSNTFETEQIRHRRNQQARGNQPQQLGRGGLVPGGQAPAGIPRDLMARLAASQAG